MTAQAMPKSYVELRGKRPRNDEPFKVGGCFWTINDGGTRFYGGGRPELKVVSAEARIAAFRKVNDSLAQKAEILSPAGIPVQGITGSEMHVPNEADGESFPGIAKALKANGMVVSMMTANLFYTFPNGALSSTDPQERARAIQWAKDTVDLSYRAEAELGHLPTNVFWPGGEGAQCMFEKDFVLALHLYADSMNQIMDYEASKGGRILFAGEAKPNEPKNVIILPVTADFLALLPALLKPEYAARFGVNPETAHEMLANLSPAIPVALALSLGKLFHYHSNWQDGLKWDQDYGVPVNLQMLEVVHYMKEYGFNGFIGLDMQARPESKDVTKVMEYSVMNLRILEALERKVDWAYVDELRQSGTPEMVTQYVNMCMLTLLSGVDAKSLV